MADAATQQLIDQIVQQKVQAGEMFTAYDVTLVARQRGGNVRHNDVRDLVHEFFEQGRMGPAYGRTAIDVGAPTRPFLYHRFSDDPRQYQSPTGTASAASPASAATPQSRPGLFRRLIGKLLGTTPSAPSGPGRAAPPSAPGRTTPGASSPRAARKSVTLGLDAANFLPIGREELRAAAKKVRLWASPWFGRRDLIPPADDERTKLIDRALVTHGLLSPEQLAEIHRVGAEMDRLRPDIIALRHQAHQAGEEAVEAERAKKAQLKVQKKAEAAERRKRKSEAIAHRRATDIVFLGRNVSGRLGDRTSDAQKLASIGLPLLSTPADVAAALGLTIPQLRWLAFHTEVATRIHYVHFTVPKRGGGVRNLSAPHRRLSDAQSWILKNVLTKVPVLDCAQGFISGRSILTNASQHVDRAVVVNMDLEAFFPTIMFPRVRSVFQRCGYSPAVATILALLSTECPRRLVEYDGKPYYVATGPRGLPQGACTSPALSNQVARRLDKRLLGLAAKLGLSFTRYADDLTFSGGAELKERVGYLMARVRHIAQDDGFAVNEKKSRVLRRNTAQLVTGLVVNDRPGVRRREVRRIRAILHRARTGGLDVQNRQVHPNFRAWLEGKIAYIGMARPELGKRLNDELQAIVKKT